MVGSHFPGVTTPVAVPVPPVSAAQANEAIRRYVLERRSWSRAELAELDRLRAVWREAVRASVDTAA